jgi:ferritin-like metal-binding protein YciE
MSTSSTGCYGTAAALAGQLDLREDQRILYESLEEEKRADELLTLLAKREVNPDSVSAFAINPAAS